MAELAHHLLLGHNHPIISPTGDCVADGTRRHCRCHNDADNLYDNSANICIRRCSFRADCKNLGINVAPPPSMSPPHTPSPANTLNYR
ncbi:hypothetical protein E3N88_05549 [Mikania micrantha]|uniref:Uncharacterized protein n=1 Tax=Mikania micrantha TaxID=192012 RepID=A0A5N6PL89_9ASTR|nr:hypothetical protein E3N88_05549 [Mikania micrantha]